MHHRFLLLARGAFAAGIILGFVFIIPSAWFPLQLGKLAVMAACMALSALCFFLSGARPLMRARSLLLIGLGALVPLAYLLSFYFSVDRSVGLSGFSVDGDTTLFVCFGFLAYALAVQLFRTSRSVRVLLYSVAVSALLAGIFQYVVILFGTSVLPAAFADRSVNVIGKWNDLGLLVGLFLMLIFFVLEWADLSLPRRIVAWALGLCALLLLAIIHFPLAWSLLLAFCLFLALWSFVAKRSPERGVFARVPWLPVAGALVSGVLLLWGSVVNTNLTTVFPVSSLEVRPSFSSTLDIIQAAHGSSVGRFLVGTGPQTFGDEWLLHKPSSVNQSPFWDLDFSIGFSSFMTAVGTVGLLGAFAWLVPVFAALLGLVFLMRSPLPQRERLVELALGFSALYLWCAFLFYVPSESLIIAAFALTGALVGLVWNRHVEGEQAPARMPYGALALGAVLLLAFIGAGVAVARRAVAESYTDQGLILLQQNNPGAALALAARARGVEQNGDDARLATDAGTAALQALAGTQNPSQQQIAGFVSQASSTIAAGQQAVLDNPQDYRAYLSLGKAYDLLASLGVSGAYANAESAYQSAAALDPMNPQIPLLLARLEAGNNNPSAAQTDLSRSLTLKPDYTDAILFVVQIDVADNDIASAIQAAQAAVQSAPGVQSIWFELGLLYYSSNDTADAIPVLEQAVKLESDYANAKYFLGLSYAAQGRAQDAIQQFSDLQKSNPDNQEVQLILGNLQAGKQPFAGAQPPVTPTPQSRTEAPISQ